MGYEGEGGMSKNIKPGMMCWLKNCTQPENNNKVVETIKWVEAKTPVEGYPSGCRVSGWHIKSKSTLKIRNQQQHYGVATNEQLVPISDPDIDTSEHDERVKDKEKEHAH